MHADCSRFVCSSYFLAWVLLLISEQYKLKAFDNVIYVLGGMLSTILTTRVASALIHDANSRSQLQNRSITLSL